MAVDSKPVIKPQNGTSLPADGSVVPGPAGTTANPEDSETTEETTLVSALSLLNQMHQKLTLLRESIPHMVQPIMKASSYPTPERLFDDFSKRTLKASEDLVDFTTLVSDGKWVFEKATASRRDNGDNGEVKRWKSSAPVPHYLKELLDAGGSGSSAKDGEAKKKEEEERKRREAEKDKEREVEIEEVKVMESEETRNGIVEAFKKEYTDLEVTYEDDGQTIKVALPKALNLTFSVEIPEASAESNRYPVTLPASSYLHVLILRSVTTRPNAGSLKYLLDMIATYQTIYKTKCSKCNKLTFGPKADLPVVRRLKRTVKVIKKEKKDEEDGKDGDKMDTSADGKAKEKVAADKDDKGKAAQNEKSKERSDTADDDGEVELIEEFWVAYHESCVN
ncbi:hypothetical protein H072_4822 [Dactylellina haptotyla CBS 200.50]|uniref:Uncharacterized protein n=1 Tax=Dactylellina haptotyla (strain CBS 200.50) TaxID=1284197 RepID=S8C0W6_DACHA|nr:hypothetical protein H072_4822 [Dactylellina haptotyla CBS 200.50]